SIRARIESITQWTFPQVAEDQHRAEPLLIASLCAHLERAAQNVDYISELEEQQESFNGLYKNMPWPMLMLDSNMLVIEANQAAHQLLDQHAPISINADASLKFRDKTLQAALQCALEMEAGPDNQMFNSAQDQISLLYTNTVKTGFKSKSGSCRAVIWVLSGEYKIVPPAHIIQTVFGITSAEAKLLYTLCQCGNLNDCAQHLTVSVHTVRSQLKSIMAKTHINSQVQLVAHVMGYAFLNTAINNACDAQEQRMTLPDGRVLTWFEYGATQGRPVVVLEDLGAGAPHHAIYHSWYRQQNLRVILVIRPGYGASAANSSISFVGFAEDLKYLCDYLTLQRPAIATFCVGGAYALCAAATHTELFDRVGVLATTVPIELFELNKLDWMHALLLLMYKTDTRLFAMFARLALRGVRRAPKKYFARVAQSLSKRDCELLNTADVLERTIQQVQLRHCQGAEIVVIEYMLVMQPWQVNLADIKIPALMWHGSCDPTISIGSARALAKCIPGVVFKELDGHGHFAAHDVWTDFVVALLKL
ncbi:MAG: alpha/beta fold hydrolase, partial [Moraxellaceae bacterium]